MARKAVQTKTSPAPFAVPSWPANNVKTWKIGDIIPYPGNARTHPDSQIKLLASMMSRYGVDQPIVVDENGIILKGHGRRLAGLEAKFEEFPVVQHHGLSETEKRAMRLEDNQVALLSGWNPQLVKLEVEAVKLDGYNLKMLGFPEAQLRGFGVAMGDAGNGDADSVPEPPESPVTRPGDVWILGKHRLACGDCTDPKIVEKLLAGEKPNLMVTDQPYGVEYDANWRNERTRDNGKAIGAAAIGKVQNDDRADWRAAWKLFDGDVAYVWTAGLRSRESVEALESAGFVMRAQIIWAKDRFVISRGDYHFQHEPCQPAGTMVRKVISEGRWRKRSKIVEVPIESLRNGDKVVSYKGTVHQRGRSIKVASRQYNGNMHIVRVGAKSTRATSEHQFTIRINPASSNKHVVYLMQRGDRWRIGRVRLMNSRGFGPAVRLDQEKGDRIWILSVWDTAADAVVEEQAISCLYQIPTTHWETDRNAPGISVRTQGHIAAIYARIGTAIIQEGAMRLLSDHGRNIYYALIENGSIGRFSRRQTRLVRACNLVPGIMQVPVPTQGEEFQWQTIENISWAPYSGKVYSMDVHGHHHYVADGIVTHNCWYAVRKGRPGNWNGGRSQTTLWDDIQHQKSETGHSTQKPVECMKRPIENNSKAGDAVYEPFSGSFTTGIACEMTARRCYAIELDPSYVDLGVLRWEQFTGRKAVLEATGKSYEATRAERTPQKKRAPVGRAGRSKAKGKAA